MDLVSNKNVGLGLLTIVLAASFLLSAPSTSGAPLHPAKDQAIAVSEEQIDNKPYSVTHVLVHARPEQVWQVLTDYGTAATVFPTLQQCQVVTEHGTTKVVHYRVHPTGCLTNFQYDLEVRETACKRVDWRRLEGDFKEIIGYWKLEPAESGHATLVTYASYVNGGLFMPQPLIKRQSRIDLPAIMTALKEHAETLQIASSGHPHHSD